MSCDDSDQQDDRSKSETGVRKGALASDA